jgi:hypothetical protein
VAGMRLTGVLNEVPDVLLMSSSPECWSSMSAACVGVLKTCMCCVQSALAACSGLHHYTWYTCSGLHHYTWCALGAHTLRVTEVMATYILIYICCESTCMLSFVFERAFEPAGYGPVKAPFRIETAGPSARYTATIRLVIHTLLLQVSPVRSSQRISTGYEPNPHPRGRHRSRVNPCSAARHWHDGRL